MSNVKQYREVSRKANAGERIKIVNAAYAGNPPAYANGDIVTVIERADDRSIHIDRKWDNGRTYAWVYDREYVVLEPVVAPTPVSVNLPDLFAQFIRDNAGAVRSYLAELDPVESAEEAQTDVVVVTQTDPLTRAKVIEMARGRVAELERIGRDRSETLTGSEDFGSHFYALEFVVNREKRVVTALVHNTNHRGRRLTRKPDAVAIAKCAPDDVFNADIGKAIAAERALGLTLTDAFVNAPKPTEPVVGMRVENRGRVRTVVASSKDYVSGKTGTLKSQGVRESRIIDDTDAVYGGEREAA